MAKIGVLLLNIGSPNSYEVEDVKRYLTNFLMDKEVINAPFIVRWPLVNLLIVPKRAPHSAANYKKIWIEGEGSPLTVYTHRFAAKLQQNLGKDYSVKVGMRHADPTILRALDEFQQEGIESLLLAPMFPQYAEATTGSSVKEVEKQLHGRGFQIPTQVLPPFFNAEAFVAPSVERTQQVLQEKQVDHYLFSFHGLPESHIRKVEGCLVSPDCCFEKDACQKNCYRAQCFASATEIAERLGISDRHWSVSFQSRLGRAEWLKPSTEHSLEVLAKTGKKSVAVLCPSFVADCIETLEEIGIGGKEAFEENGGQEFHLIPCVNEDSHWVEGFSDLVRRHSH